MHIKLDDKKSDTPYNVIHIQNKEYKSQYRQLILQEQAKNKKLIREVGMCRVRNFLLHFRRFFSFIFVLLFLATSLMYCGFATSFISCCVILGLVACILVVDIVFLALALFRRAFFCDVITKVHSLNIVCALVIAVIILGFFQANAYLFVALTLFVLLIQNQDDAASVNHFRLIHRILSLLIALFFIAIAVPPILGANILHIEHSSIRYDRGLHSRLAQYEVAKTNGEKSAIFSSVLLTANDVLGGAEVYTVKATLMDETEIISNIEDFFTQKVFKGDRKVVNTIDNIDSYILKNYFGIDEADKNEIKVSAVGAKSFKGANAIKTVVLPSSVTDIHAEAFVGSQVQTIEVYASEIHIEDAFEGSSVRCVRLLSPQATKIIISDTNALSADIAFFVPESLIGDYRALNPELSDYITVMQE